MTRTRANRHHKRKLWPRISDPHHAAMKIAEAVDEAWYSSGRPSSDDAICAGVVAALCLLRSRTGGTTQMVPGPDGPDGLQIEVAGPDMPVGVDLRDFLMACPDQVIASFLKQIWTFFWVMRPELAIRVGPFADWLNGDGEPDEQIVRVAARVARAAVKHGLLSDTGNGWSLAQETDVIGTVYTSMRSSGARRGTGEFYTPPAVCYMMAKMAMIGPGGKRLEPGMSIAEPSAGTGGMLRGMMQAMVEDGLDPADFRWFVNDISAVPVAGLAVNCHLWGLGYGVVCGIANSLAEPDWYGRAIKEQLDAVSLRDSMWRGARMISLLNQVSRPADADADAGPPPEPPPLPDWLAKLAGVEEGALFTPAPDVELAPAGAAAPRGGRARRAEPAAAEADPGDMLF